MTVLSPYTSLLVSRPRNWPKAFQIVQKSSFLFLVTESDGLVLVRRSHDQPRGLFTVFETSRLI